MLCTKSIMSEKSISIPLKLVWGFTSTGAHPCKRDILWITAKIADMSMHPVYRDTLIAKAIVGLVAC